MDIDPIVEEMRRNSADTANKYGGDVHELAAHYRREQAKHPATRIVRRKPTPDNRAANA